MIFTIHDCIFYKYHITSSSKAPTPIAYVFKDCFESLVRMNFKMTDILFCVQTNILSWNCITFTDEALFSDNRRFQINIAPSWFSPNAIIGNLKCTEALRTVNTRAVAVFVMGWWVKFTKFHQDWNSLSKSVALSQILFWISVGKLPSPSLIIEAATDCIDNCAWIELRAKERLFCVAPSASVYQFVITYIYLFPSW